jgi:hypothetical protein
MVYYLTHYFHSTHSPKVPQDLKAQQNYLLMGSGKYNKATPYPDFVYKLAAISSLSPSKPEFPQTHIQVEQSTLFL